MKKYSVIYILLLAFLVSSPLLGQTTSKFEKNEVEISKWVKGNFKKGKIPPFSFVYDGKLSSDFIKKWKFSSQMLGEIEKDIFNNIYTWQDNETKMKVVCDVRYYPSHKAVEWVLRFTNESSANSPTIEKVKVIDMNFQYEADDIILHYADGTHVSKADFHPRKKILKSGESFEISPQDGRSSDNAFPFFNIESGSGLGAMFAVGWSGTWYSQFEKQSNNSISFNSGMKWLETYLKANETIRTPSICLLFWKGEDRMIGHNAFRQFMIHHQAPKVNGKPTVYPVSTSFNYGDPHPCNEYTCLTTDYALAMINRYKHFKLVPEVFWLDAGWYIKANQVENNKNWANTVGNWEVDQTRFPGGLKPISDAVHEAGAKFMVWFEPERVIKESNWGRELRKYMLDAKGTDAYLFDLGNKEALDWLCKFIGDFMEENGIDYYRQDFNMRVDNYWRENEEPGRTGIREIRHIEGLYAFWDYILKRFPESLVDNCASGGRRIDFESMKRSAPMWRTDYHYGEPIGYQSHTYGLNFFLPLTGTGVEKSDKFTFRSSLGTSVIFNWKITEGSSSFTEMQRCFKEFMNLRPYFYEDYYPLTSYEDMTTDDIWLAYQLHRSSDDTGVVVAFRREQSPDETITVRLSGVDVKNTYKVTNQDTNETVEKTGEELKNGLRLTLPDKRSSLILTYKK